MRKGLLIAAVLYPLAVHFAILAQASVVAVALLAIIAGLHALARRPGLPRLRRSPWVWTYLALAAAGAASLAVGAVAALYLPPVLINLVLLGVFARSLRAGETPLIERFMRLEYGGAPPPPLVRYGRQLTALWSAFFALSAVLAVVLAFAAPLFVWSLWVNVGNFVAIALLYGVQYAYLYWRYRALELHSPWAWLRVLVRLRSDDPLHPFYAELRTR